MTLYFQIGIVSLFPPRCHFFLASPLFLGHRLQPPLSLSSACLRQLRHVRAPCCCQAATACGGCPWRTRRPPRRRRSRRRPPSRCTGSPRTSSPPPPASPLPRSPAGSGCTTCSGSRLRRRSRPRTHVTSRTKTKLRKGKGRDLHATKSDDALICRK